MNGGALPSVKLRAWDLICKERVLTVFMPRGVSSIFAASVSSDDSFL